MKLVKISAMISLFTLSLITACSYDKEILPQQMNCASINARFSTDVNPIIQSSCANNSACHGTGSANGPGELLTYDQIRAAADMIRPAVESGRMPLGSTLSQADINKISCWVKSGAQNN